jgi:hypothetical protein
MTPSTNHEATVKRLIRLYDKTTTLEKAQGLTWYANEGAWITATAAVFETSPAHVVAAYAALSPRLRVSKNREAIVGLLSGRRRSGVFGRSQNMALAALGIGASALRGPKVTRFACNLGGCQQCVTLDTHAVKAAGGDPKRFDYDKLEAAYQAAAKRLGIPPAVLQATLWVQERGKAN